MQAIQLEDRRRHHPAPTAASNWQESFYLGWVDLEHNLAGAHHISLAPQGSSHVWSWLLVDGKVVARKQEHDLPLPEGDLEDLQLGSLHVTAGETLRDLRLRAAFDNAEADLTLRALCDPVVVNLNHDDTILAERHYEAMGLISGRVRVGDRSFDVEATGWHDHSWGAREFKSNPSHRWLFAVFGDDLAISAFLFVTGQRRASFGWVYERGVVRAVTRVAFHAIVNDDGMTPEGCNAEVLTEGGRGYRVRGVCRASALMGGMGWFGLDGITEFECGGRLGQGFLEVAELKTMTTDMLSELGL